MNSRHNSIVLVDQHVELNSDWSRKMNYKKENYVILDPVKLFSEIDWTQYEDDIRIINKIYSRLFEDVVMSNKTLICFWPLNQKFGMEWVELTLLCKANSYNLEINKSLSFDDINYGFDEIILTSWKRFIYFLIESLFEDIQLNEEFKEIATLKSDNETIVLFKLEKQGKTRYSYAFDSEFLGIEQINAADPNGVDRTIQAFETFNEMLEKLLKENDLSLFLPQFGDKGLEKAYFRILSKEIKTKNLIESWLKSYSMN